MVDTWIMIMITVMIIGGGVLGFVGSWLGWPVFMLAQTSLMIYCMYIHEWAWAFAAVLMAWAYTWGWLKVMQARITRDGVEVSE